MYCHACGVALTQQTKFCNRCGVELITSGGALKQQTALEKRVDGSLDSVFWVSVFGLGIIVGGSILLKQVGFGDLVILIYAVLSSLIFLINLGLNVWGSVGLIRRAKERNASIQQTPETAELNPARPEAFLTPVHSVTENTTRSFEPVPRVNRSGSE